MNQQLQQLVDKWTNRYGLQQYEIGTYHFFKQATLDGVVQYHLTVEFYPKGASPYEEDELNPDGTAIIDYNLTTETIVSILFVNAQSFATTHPFPTQTVQEVAQWIETETGYTYGDHFVAVDTVDNGYLFEGVINGYSVCPTATIEIQFDNEGKLTTFHMQHMEYIDGAVPEETFPITIEQLSSHISDQLTFMYYPIEETEKWLPIYILEEGLFTKDGRYKPIPEDFSQPVHTPLYWDAPLANTINRQPIEPFQHIPADEAFAYAKTTEKLYVTTEQQKNIKIIAIDVLRTIHPYESGQWQLSTIRPKPNFIEVFCEKINESNAIIPRKVVLLLQNDTLDILNYIDNKEMLTIFDHFRMTDNVQVTKEEAFHKLSSEIISTPTYRFNEQTKNYALCLKVHSTHVIDASTGELISLTDI